MNPFTEKVIEHIKAVPYGRVATYGQIAKLAGNPRSARQVSRILHTMSKKHNLPWHRIINAQGKIVIADPTRQVDLLLEEGVEVTDGNKVDLAVFKWETEMYDYWMQG